MSRRFTQLDFGPMRLRAVLRDALQPGERVIGWASVQEQAPTSLAFFRIGLAIMPGIGQVLSLAAGAALGPPRLLMIVTDERLMLVVAAPGGRSGRVPRLEHEFGLGELRVQIGMFGNSFAIATPGRPVKRYDVEPRHSRPAQRLWHALALMDPDAAERLDLNVQSEDQDEPLQPAPAWQPARPSTPPRRGAG